MFTWSSLITALALVNVVLGGPTLDKRQYYPGCSQIEAYSCGTSPNCYPNAKWCLVGQGAGQVNVCCV
ncbi:hypothetical protein CLAFUW4_20079 [Fulvia fulva]|uniref:Putative effector 45 n=1 Tax=Passalora fulva TaxID=5499 RepID=A0A1P8YXL9_PASFU|nr:uncharacterized protein CLAFUR5_20079 [Fulvia fulva]AQA29248.1 putative effector 45 [Fulvia fulva]KAK4613653.1 hypothetical protein CLAFUR4_20079 [Fulvia fulva]KAK4615269.1 hypothetical protein CLAFUR0_20079 [Fulvia fulva]WMI39000.1 hypothetical protein CLAFUR5_20079 [Fulvia fulva]WPV20441.1 hypothetical protein CLAFUW4_20079 [Fulvia fulva]